MVKALRRGPGWLHAASELFGGDQAVSSQETFSDADLLLQTLLLRSLGGQVLGEDGLEGVDTAITGSPEHGAG